MTPTLRAQIMEQAAASPLRRYSWRGRGVAPVGYIKGMALAFAQCYTDLKSGDSSALDMAQPLVSTNRDAMFWYREKFRDADMMDSRPVDILRHLFVLMYGLGMRESSGEFAEGRDMSASNVSGATAEAGLFQQSWNSHVCSPEIPKLKAKYRQGNPDSANLDCFLDVFREGATKLHSQSVGHGEGLEFQILAKSCPMFAVACAAVGLRHLKSHWGPIVNHAAELRQEANILLLKVQGLVDAPLPPAGDELVA